MYGWRPPWEIDGVAVAGWLPPKLAAGFSELVVPIQRAAIPPDRRTIDIRSPAWDTYISAI